MSGDRSLDEFVSGGESSTESDGDESSTDPDGDAGDGPARELDGDSGDEWTAESDGDTDGEVGSDASETVEPAESTYAWSPSGATCDACGASVERRWRDEGDLVCADCKSW